MENAVRLMVTINVPLSVLQIPVLTECENSAMGVRLGILQIICIIFYIVRQKCVTASGKIVQMISLEEVRKYLFLVGDKTKMSSCRSLLHNKASLSETINKQSTAPNQVRNHKSFKIEANLLRRPASACSKPREPGPGCGDKMIFFVGIFERFLSIS